MKLITLKTRVAKTDSNIESAREKIGKAGLEHAGPERFLKLQISPARRVSGPSVYRWMKERKVEWLELPNGRRRIYLDSLFRERRS